MKIEINKKEYRSLLDLLLMADWIMHSHEEEEGKPENDIDKLIRKLHSFATEFGMDDLIELDSKIDKYFPTQKFEEETKSQEFFEEYDEQIFWDELIGRLAQRDALEKMPLGDNPTEKELEKFLEIQFQIEETYAEEFSGNGLSNLLLKPGKKSKKGVDFSKSN